MCSRPLVWAISSPALRQLNRVALLWSAQAQSAISVASALAPKAAERNVLAHAIDLQARGTVALHAKPGGALRVLKA